MFYNKQGYSVIISMLLIGFLLILTTGVFNLVQKEYKDNRGLGDSIKAFAGAEASQELALLKIKEKGYGIDYKIEHIPNSTGSVILSENPNDIGDFNRNNDVFISYDLGVAAEFNGSNYEYSETLDSQGYSIIPLFLEEDLGTTYVSDYSVIINAGNASDVVWNLISGDQGISNRGNNFGNGEGKIVTLGVAEFTSSDIGNFLSTRDQAYLILFNTSASEVTYTITSAQKFSKPQTKIISSAQVGNYKHNLETKYNNTEFLNMLKYAVFSN